jgi:CheY-like chemotaxis protein
MATILVVDDSPVSRRVLGYTLKHNGHLVLDACNGQEALDLLGEQLVDLVITDLAMPEMDGLTLLRHIRGDERLQDTKLVMLTASGQDQDQRDALVAGANDFLTKPASSRELLATVGRLLG